MLAFKNNNQKGFTLLFSIIVSSVVLAVGLSILSISVKQISLSGISRNSEMAFYAANAGAECLRAYDAPAIGGGVFDVPGDGSIDYDLVTISCFGQLLPNQSAIKQSGLGQRFEATWGTAPNKVCTDATIYKFYEDPAADADDLGDFMYSAGISRRCPEGAECTVIKARGYNRACNSITNFDRTVERELTYIY